MDATNGTTISESKDGGDGRKYRVDVEMLINFIFPANLQHPLAAGRLYAFGYVIAVRFEAIISCFCVRLLA
jgi:hypothetical protein